MTNFLPDDYEVPKVDSRFLKLGDGDNKFLIIGPVTLGYKYWNTDKKSVLLRDKPKNVPDDIGNTPDGKQDTVKHFWAFPIYRHDLKKFQIYELTQLSIMGKLQDLARDKDWGDPVFRYQINIKKSGSGLKTEYEVLPVPLGTLTDIIDLIKQGYEESDIDMADYFNNIPEDAKEESTDEIAKSIDMN